MKTSIITVTLALAMCCATRAWACDAEAFAVSSYEQALNGAHCEYRAESGGEKQYDCHIDNLNEIYYQIFTQEFNDEYELTVTKACFSNGGPCTFWYDGHCTCDECVIDGYYGPNF